MTPTNSLKKHQYWLKYLRALSTMFMVNELKKGILLVAPLKGAVTGQAIMSQAVQKALAQYDKVFQINTNFESLSTARKISEQVKVLAQIIRQFGNYDRVYLSFKRGSISVLFDYIFLLAIRTMRPRLIVGHLHGNEMLGQEKKKWIHHIFAKNLKMCDQIICLNSYQKVQLETDFGVNKHNVIPNFSSLSLPLATLETRLSERKRHGDLNVMYFSNLMVQKGIINFLDVAADTKDGIQFKIFGKALKADALDAITICERLGNLPANTRYFGPVYGNDRLSAFENIDIILFPSTYATEAQPLVIIEAMSMGIIPIVYDRNYASDIIPPQSEAGFRVQDGSLNDIIALLYHLRDEPETVIRMRRAAWTHAQNFSQDKFSQTICTLMQSSNMEEVSSVETGH